MKTRKLLSAAPLLVLLAACSNATSAPPSTDAESNEPDIGVQAQELDTQGFLQARGYFMNTDTVAGDCVESATGGVIAPEQAPNTGGQEVIFSLSLLESSTDVQKSLSVSASASAKFLIAGGDAKFKFAEDTKTSDTTATLLASVTVRNTSWTAPPGTKLKESALSLLRGVAGQPATAKQLARFRQRCGDGFLQSYTTGGEFFAAIQVQTSSAEEKKAVSSSIAGNYLTFSGSAEFSTALSKIVNNSSTVVRTYQIGGESTDAAACSDVSCVTARISSFTSAVSKKPVVFSTTVKPYKVLALPNDATTPTDIAVTLDAMETINRERNSARDLLNRLIDVQTDPETYVASKSTLATVGAAISTINGNMNTLNAALKTCGRTPALCAMPALTAVSVTVPGRKPLPTKVILRSYAKPSGLVMDGAGLRACSGTWARYRVADTRDLADYATLNIVPAVNGAPGGISLQSLLTPTAALSANMASPCAQRVNYTVPTTSDAKERATFYRVKGLNGKPNTWSFRLYATPDPEGVGSANRNRDPNMYLSTSSVAALAVYSLPAPGSTAAVVDAYNDAVSFYVDPQ
jgi:hypothetical protein